MDDGEKFCPECAETVKAAASVCRYCGCRFSATVDTDARKGAGPRRRPIALILLVALGVVVAGGVVVAIGNAGSSPEPLSESDSARFRKAASNTISLCTRYEIVIAADSGDPGALESAEDTLDAWDSTPADVSTMVSIFRAHPDGYTVLKDGRHDPIRAGIEYAAEGLDKCAADLSPPLHRALRSAESE